MEPTGRVKCTMFRRVQEQQLPSGQSPRATRELTPVKPTQTSQTDHRIVSFKTAFDHNTAGWMKKRTDEKMGALMLSARSKVNPESRRDRMEVRNPREDRANIQKEAEADKQALREMVSEVSDDTKVLECYFPLGGGKSLESHYWYQERPSTFTNALAERLPGDHPVLGIGPAREKCPGRFEMKCRGLGR